MNKPLDLDMLDQIADRAAVFDAFIHHVSHDVRASAQALADIPAWVKEDIEAAGQTLSTDAADSLDMLVRHAKRLDRMLEDLTAYSFIGREQAVERLDPAVMLPALVAKNRDFQCWDIRLDMASCPVMLGARDAGMLFGALISNAIKHCDTPDGVLEISSKIDEETLILRFADDGPGIEARFHAKIFEMMTTLKPRDSVEGSGLGLPMAQKICGLYGGRITVESDPPKRGCVFEVTLPRAP